MSRPARAPSPGSGRPPPGAAASRPPAVAPLPSARVDAGFGTATLGGPCDSVVWCDNTRAISSIYLIPKLGFMKTNPLRACHTATAAPIFRTVFQLRNVPAPPARAGVIAAASREPGDPVRQVHPEVAVDHRHALALRRGTGSSRSATSASAGARITRTATRDGSRAAASGKRVAAHQRRPAVAGAHDDVDRPAEPRRERRLERAPRRPARPAHRRLEDQVAGREQRPRPAKPSSAASATQLRRCAPAAPGRARCCRAGPPRSGHRPPPPFEDRQPPRPHALAERDQAAGLAEQPVAARPAQGASAAADRPEAPAREQARARGRHHEHPPAVRARQRRLDQPPAEPGPRWSAAHHQRAELDGARARPAGAARSRPPRRRRSATTKFRQSSPSRVHPLAAHQRPHRPASSAAAAGLTAARSSSPRSACVAGHRILPRVVAGSAGAPLLAAAHAACPPTAPGNCRRHGTLEPAEGRRLDDGRGRLLRRDGGGRARDPARDEHLRADALPLGDRLRGRRRWSSGAAPAGFAQVRSRAPAGCTSSATSSTTPARTSGSSRWRRSRSASSWRSSSPTRSGWRCSRRSCSASG